MKSKSSPTISDAEWRILETLWTDHPATAEDVVARLGSDSDWHPRTIKTLLHRLVRKGALEFTRDGKRYLYSPAVTREACIRAASRSFLDRVFGGAAAPAIVHMVEESRLTREDISRLKAILEAKLDTGKKARRK